VFRRSQAERPSPEVAHDDGSDGSIDDPAGGRAPNVISID
jgi:hypothetical protein